MINSPAFSEGEIFQWSAGTFGCNQGPQNEYGEGSGVCGQITSLTAQAYSLCGWGGTPPSYTFSYAGGANAYCTAGGDVKELALSPGGCPVGQYINEVTQLCDPDGDPPPPEECELGDMVVFDQSTSEIVSCNPGPTECQNSLGTVDFGDGEFEYCSDQQDECTALGGTFGAVGNGSEMGAVCLLNGGTPPTCASGSENWVENLDGSSAFSCTPTDPTPTICDAQLYDCDDDGFVDDQDNDGCIDNGSANDPACIPTAPGTPGPNNGDPTEPGTDDPTDEPSNVGEEPLDPATEGAGDCDPTASDYAQCIGNLVKVREGYIDELRTGFDSDATGYLDSLEIMATDSIGDGNSGITGTTAIGTSITSSFSVGGCSDITLSYHGETLTISCSKMQIFRDILFWVVGLMTTIAVFAIATAPPTR